MMQWGKHQAWEDLGFLPEVHTDAYKLRSKLSPWMVQVACILSDAQPTECPCVCHDSWQAACVAVRSPWQHGCCADMQTQKMQDEYCMPSKYTKAIESVTCRVVCRRRRLERHRDGAFEQHSLCRVTCPCMPRESWESAWRVQYVYGSVPFPMSTCEGWEGSNYIHVKSHHCCRCALRAHPCHGPQPNFVL